MLENLSKYKIVLASNSPRRKELLAGLGLEFEVRTIPGIDESYPRELKGEAIPKYISAKKAEAYRGTMGDDELIITADTIVYVDDQVLGKPVDADDARRMFRMMSGRSHQVITGVSVVTKDNVICFATTTSVTFAQLTDDEVEYYIERYKPFDKAGAYGIQEWIGYVGITSIEGSYYNVVGLPVQRLYTELRKL